MMMMMSSMTCMMERHYKHLDEDDDDDDQDNEEDDDEEEEDDDDEEEEDDEEDDDDDVINDMHDGEALQVQASLSSDVKESSSYHDISSSSSIKLLQYRGMGKKYLKVSHMKRQVSPETDAVVPRRVVLYVLPVRHHHHHSMVGI